MSLPTKHSRSRGAVAAIALWVVLGAIASIVACATTGGEAPSAKISPERQKAIQDSLHRVWERERNIKWSTAYEHYKNKNYSDAIRPFWSAAELDTSHFFKPLYTYLADAYFQMNQIDSAEVVYRKGIQVFPENVHLHRSLGYILSNKNDIPNAIKEYQSVVGLAPEGADDWRILANLYLRDDRYGEAIEAFKRILELEPSDKAAQETLANLYKREGREDEALTEMERVIALDSTNTAMLFDVAREYVRRADYVTAVDRLEMLVRQTPDDALAWEYMGNALQNLEHFNRAIRAYEKVMVQDASNKKILCEIASCYRQSGRLRRARTYAIKALAIDRKFGLAHIVLAEIYESQIDQCMDARGAKSPDFHDKLVYQRAHKEYRIAARDPEWADTAQSRIEYSKTLIPTDEDRFFNQGVTKPKYDCYKWLY